VLPRDHEAATVRIDSQVRIDLCSVGQIADQKLVLGHRSIRGEQFGKDPAVPVVAAPDHDRGSICANRGRRLLLVIVRGGINVEFIAHKLDGRRKQLAAFEDFEFQSAYIHGTVSLVTAEWMGF